MGPNCLDGSFQKMNERINLGWRCLIPAHICVRAD